MSDTLLVGNVAGFEPAPFEGTVAFTTGEIRCVGLSRHTHQHYFLITLQGLQCRRFSAVQARRSFRNFQEQTTPADYTRLTKRSDAEFMQ